MARVFCAQRKVLNVITTEVIKVKEGRILSVESPWAENKTGINKIFCAIEIKLFLDKRRRNRVTSELLMNIIKLLN